MKKAVILAAAVAVMAVPAVAIAKGPPSGKGSGGTHGKSAPKVMYVLKGTLSGYTAANGSTNGSITIAVSHSNRHGQALKGQSLTIPVSAATKISLASGLTTIAAGDRGIVKIRAPKKVLASDLLSTIEAASAFQVVDQGSATSG